MERIERVLALLREWWGSPQVGSARARLAAGLRRIPRRARAAIALGLVAVAVVGIVLVATTAKPAPEPSAAAAFIGGAYLGPPYTVKAENGDVLVNGVRARPMPRRPEPIAPPSDPKNVDDLAAIAAARIEKASVSDAELDAAIAQLRAFPATADVERRDDSIVITDRAGATTEVLYRVRTAATEEQVRDAQEAVAARWQALLDDGGILLTADGVEVTVPAVEAAGFLSAVSDVFAMGPDERMSAMGRLTGSLAVAEAMLRAGPSEQLQRRVAMWPQPVREAAARHGLAALAPGAAGIETPKVPRAHIFDYFEIKEEIERVRGTLDRSGYQTILHPGAYQGSGGGRWVRDFAYISQTGGAAVVYLAVHGSRTGIQLEGAANVDEAKKRYQEYLSTGFFRPEDIRRDGRYVVITKAGISRFFRDQNTIVHLSICWGWYLRDAFAGAREFIGADQPTDAYEALAFVNALYPRLEGTKDEGKQRRFGDAAGVALKEYETWRAANPDRSRTRARYFHQGGGDTVLAPAVAEVAPTSGIAPKKRVSGHVRFDAAMDTGIAATSVLDLIGCRGRFVAGSVKWQDPRTLAFAVEVEEQGTLALTVIATGARSAGAQIALDGNTPRKDRGAPNGDDFVWTIPCEPGALGQRPAEAQTRLGSFSASTDKARVGEKVTLTVSVNSGDAWLCGGERQLPGGVRFVSVSGIPGAKLVDWSPKQLGRPGARVEGPPQSGAITWRAGEANPSPPGCREGPPPGGSSSGLFKSGDVFTATYEVTAPTADWVLLRASIQNEQGTGNAAVAFAATGQASPTPSRTTAATPTRATTAPPSDPAILLKRCSPNTVTPDRARPLVGREVTLCFPVTKVETTGIGSTVLWSGETAPRVAAVIPKSATARFIERFGPLGLMRGLLIEASGRLVLQADVPQILLQSTNQMRLPLGDPAQQR